MDNIEAVKAFRRYLKSVCNGSKIRVFIRTPVDPRHANAFVTNNQTVKDVIADMNFTDMNVIGTVCNRTGPSYMDAQGNTWVYFEEEDAVQVILELTKEAAKQFRRRLMS